MQRVQWDAMQHQDIVRELEAGKQEAARRIEQLMAAAGIVKRGPKPIGLTSEPANEEMAAQ